MTLEQIAIKVFHMKHQTPRGWPPMSTRLALELCVENDFLPREALIKRISNINRKIKTMGLKKPPLRAKSVAMPPFRPAVVDLPRY